MGHDKTEYTTTNYTLFLVEIKKIRNYGVRLWETERTLTKAIEKGIEKVQSDIVNF